MQSVHYINLAQLEAQFWWFVGMRAITASLLAPVLSTPSDRNVLDAGCGTGGNLEWLRRYAGKGQVFGLDFAEMALQLCQQNGQHILVQASVTKLPFADSTFDLVTSFDVLEQLSATGDEQALHEMYRVLRPEGIAFVRVPAYEWMMSGHDAAINSQRRYTLGQLRTKLHRTGYEIIRATYANSLLLPVAAVRRLVLKSSGSGDDGCEVKPLPPRLQWLNSGLEQVLLAEASLLRHAKLQLPFGLSAICVAKKQGFPKSK